MSRYIISALLLLGVGTLKIGLGGAIEEGKFLTDPVIYSDQTLLNQSPVITPTTETAVKVTKAVVTGYSSRPEETDETPFITAAGTKVRPGVVAANWLPLGTKIKIPEIFGNQIFVVEDRMNERFNENVVDVWFPTTGEALRFGTQVARVEIL
jgi:3D (Asp-Asp-Asp) domain-containing protein